MLTKRKDGRYCKTLTINGKRTYFYSSEPTEKKAERDIENQLLEFKQRKEKGELFSAVADLWNTEYRLKISEITYKNSVKSAYKRICDEFKDVYIKNITILDINVFINRMIAKGYSKKTVSTHKSVLNMIFSFALLNRYIDYNPVHDIRLPNNLPKNPRTIPSTEEIKIVSAHHEGFELLPYFLLYSGLRRSEALALEWSDIDFDKKLITVNKRLAFDGNRPIIENKTKTANSERKVILLDRLADVLPKGKSGLVFSNPDNTPLTKGQYRRRWSKYQKTYNLTVTAHQLRHAYATMLFEAGVDVKDAQELMGHSDINLTRQIYTHIRNERKQETADKLNNFNF